MIWFGAITFNAPQALSLEATTSDIRLLDTTNTTTAMPACLKVLLIPLVLLGSEQNQS